MDGIIDQLDIAAKRYPIKALAPKINGTISESKAESTLRCELNQQPGYKLGLVTAIQIMQITGDTTALDRIEEVFGRVAFKLPKTDACGAVPLMKLVSQVSREFGEAVEEVAAALEDGRFTKGEAANCLKETRDLIRVAVQLEGYLQHCLEGGK